METLTIDKCPVCNSTNQEDRFDDFEGNHYVECLDCGLYFQNPRVKTQYEENYWGESIDPDGNKRILVEERDLSIKNKYALDIQHVNKLSPGRILDAGAGFGFFLSAINNDWEKHATELSEFCVEYIKENYPEVDVKTEVLECLSYPENFFDVIYCHHVIEHVEDPHSVIKNFSRMLKPNGTLIIGCPNVSSFVAKRFKGNYRLLGSPHILMWNKRTLSNILSKYRLETFDDKYPFFNTDYFTFGNLIRLIDNSKISPPFYGNLMTLYAKKKA
jgi:2-polyprenyl-3-methyl-5-hydroxy-6-metoxy-1,4-benzoquinol methylase